MPKPLALPGQCHGRRSVCSVAHRPRHPFAVTLFSRRPCVVSQWDSRSTGVARGVVRHAKAQVMPLTRPQVRHAACVTLLAWIFALVSGVANACLTQPNGRAGFGSISSEANAVVGGTSTPVTRQVQHVHHHGAGEGEDDGLGSHSAREGCLKFCADQSSAVTKSTAPQAEIAGPLFVASAQWRSAAPVTAASQWLQVEPPASVGPPLFIRLLRLTI